MVSEKNFSFYSLHLIHFVSLEEFTYIPAYMAKSSGNIRAQFGVICMLLQESIWNTFPMNNIQFAIYPRTQDVECPAGKVAKKQVWKESVFYRDNAHSPSHLLFSDLARWVNVSRRPGMHVSSQWRKDVEMTSRRRPFDPVPTGYQLN